ncbi:60S acidic ribosomal protein P1-like [Papaver somniferum]|uniref:60S acidic ribosomal protein P1-like n=1 Tax=Papaver somniferum TaxID=3469 RepID=UPI000E6F5A33|nr:60S acidic ribosomal protein P1-like [Papaver somniferum]
MSTSGELACTYAIMILHDDGIPITDEKIATLVKKANVQCESYWPGLFSKFTEKKNVEDLITATGGSGAAVVDVSASAGGGAKVVEAPAAEEKKKKEEEKEESDDDDMIMNLFD